MNMLNLAMGPAHEPSISTKTNTRPLQRIPAAITVSIAMATVMLLSGCGTWVLRADFNNYVPDTSGQQLEGQIAGKPDGDFIDMACFAADVKVLSGSPNNVLRISGCFPGGIEFGTAPHDSPAEYLIDWDGTREFAENSLLTFISFMGEGQTFTLRFMHSQLDVLVSGVPAVDAIDVSSLSSHAIRLEIKTGGNSTADLFFQERFNDGTTGPKIVRSFNLNDFTKLTEIVISAEEFGAYQISDLDIFASASTN